MRKFTMLPRALHLIVAISALVVPLFSQEPKAAEAPQAGQDQVASSSTVSSNSANSPAFFAEKYIRVVKIMANGKQVILSESRPMKVARSSEGRIRVEGISIDEECQKSAKDLSTCTSSAITLFDPAAQTVTHWGERSNNAHVSVVLPITQSRAAEIEDDTSFMPDESGSVDTEGATVIHQNLAQKTIEGIVATGIRTIVTLPARARGNKDTIITTHEVWTSAEMNLVVKIVDTKATSGEPDELETVRGLDHVDLSPDPSLFQPPGDYEHQDWRVTNPGKPGDHLAEVDMPQYAAWFLK